MHNLHDQLFFLLKINMQSILLHWSNGSLVLQAELSEPQWSKPQECLNP